MTDDNDIIEDVLAKLEEFDRQTRNCPIDFKAYATRTLGVADERQIYRLINLLLEEDIIWNTGGETRAYGPYYAFTDKGRTLMENGGWPAYKKLIDERERKAAEAARLANIKAKGEALQFKYWWVGLAGFAISVLTAGWTIYQDTTNDAPTREEYNQLVREVGQLRQARLSAQPKPNSITTAHSLSAQSNAAAKNR